MDSALHAAVDLGAGSGRVLVGAISAEGVSLEEAHRFTYAPRQSAGHLRWDFDRLIGGMRTGLRHAAALAAAANRPLRSIGVDSWGVDYGLIDRDGRLVEEPICYRDRRTAGMMERALSHIEPERLFRETGIQFLPFNTIFQLMAHAARRLPSNATGLMMIPDLCHHALCGSPNGETTNASTTGLLNIATGDWDDSLFDRLGLPRRLMPPLRPPGTALAPLRNEWGDELRLRDTLVVQPATHDTASAVAGTPLTPGRAFISSGTWSLVGVERPAPLVGSEVLAANFTNERGVCGTFRFLKNVAGLWILDRCRREWQEAGLDSYLPRLLSGAEALPQGAGLVDPDAPRFFNPSSMVDALREALMETGQPAPADPVRLTRVILDSLACRYAAVIRTIERLTGEPIEGIHVVGGGARIAYLNQATANATGRRVLAGPVEAASLGNILMQAVACGATTVVEGRQQISDAFAPRGFDPLDRNQWEGTARQYELMVRTGSSA